LRHLAGQYKHEMNEAKLKLKTELLRHGIQQKDVAQRAGASNTSVHVYFYETVKMSEELETDIENAIKLLLEEAKQGSGSTNR